MSERTFELMTADDLQAMHDNAGADALAGLDTLILDENEVSYVMPYFTAFRAYEKHVQSCTDCQDTPVWDIGCPEGNRLATISADAMAAQEDLAQQN